jgi:hypothetical protein
LAKYPEARETAVEDKELLDFMTEKNGRWTMLECYEYLMQQREIATAKKVKVETETKKKEVVSETTNKYHKIPSAQPNGGKVSEDDYETMSVEEYLRRENEKKKDFF